MMNRKLNDDTIEEIARIWNLSSKMMDSLVAAYENSPYWTKAHASQAIPLADRGLVELERYAVVNERRIKVVAGDVGEDVAQRILKARMK